MVHFLIYSLFIKKILFLYLFVTEYLYRNMSNSKKLFIVFRYNF